MLRWMIARATITTVGLLSGAGAPDFTQHSLKTRLTSDGLSNMLPAGSLGIPRFKKNAAKDCSPSWHCF